MPSTNSLFKRIGPTIVALFFLAAIFFVDWVTGYNVSVGPLYLVFVGLVTWRGGPWAGAFAVAGSLGAWAAADALNGHHYPSPWMRYENLVVRLITQGMVVFSIHTYRRTLEMHRQRVAVLEKLISVCASCGKVAVSNGEWAAPEDLVNRPKELYAICPACSSKQPVSVPPYTSHNPFN